MDTPSPLYQWRTLSLTLTYLCNLKCRMCPVIRRPKSFLTREQAFHVADFAQRRGFRDITLTGGEPTLMPWFWDLLERLAETHLDICILTNALRFTPEDIRRLAACPRLRINTSIDGLPELHDAIRGHSGAFAATEKNIRLMLDAGCRVGINTVVQKSNFRTMLGVYEYFRALPLYWHGFSFAEANYNDETVPLENLQECVDTLMEVRRRDEAGPRRAAVSLDYLQGFRLALTYPMYTMHPGEGCPIPLRHLSVEADKSVLPCYHFRWNSGVGWSLEDRTLDEIVDDPAVQDEIRRAVGPHGCPGCSTTCYFWDDDFRNRMLNPGGKLQIRRMALQAKEYLRHQHPGIFDVAKKARARISQVHHR